jgi:hypothetical protein
VVVSNKQINFKQIEEKKLLKKYENYTEITLMKKIKRRNSISYKKTQSNHNWRIH